MLVSLSASGVVLALGGSGLAADLPAGKRVPIKELHERTSSLVARDVVVVGTVEAVVAITEDNFDDWRLMAHVSKAITLRSRMRLVL